MYVDRDQDGSITATYARKQRDGQEFLEGAKVDEVVTVSSQIAALEATITSRNLRGLYSGDEWAIAHVAAVEAQISTIRA